MAEGTFNMTPEEYAALRPRQQGYITYMRAEWPGARIPKTCPHPEGSREAKQWGDGAFQSVLDAQDSEG